jgi:hypothetical protein
MKHLVLASLAGLASTVALTAAAAPTLPEGCFLTRDLRSHTIGADGHTIYLDVKGVDTYQVTTRGSCLATAITTEPMIVRDWGLGQICRPLDLEIIVRGNHCNIASLTRLTSAQASAIPKRLQP